MARSASVGGGEDASPTSGVVRPARRGRVASRAASRVAANARADGRRAGSSAAARSTSRSSAARSGSRRRVAADAGLVVAGEDGREQRAERGDVERRPQLGAVRPLVAGQSGLGQAAEHRPARAVEHDVVGVEAAVDDAQAVEVGHGPGRGGQGLEADLDRHRVGQGAGADEDRSQLAVGPPGGQLDDARVPGDRQHGGLPPEPGEGRSIGRVDSLDHERAVVVDDQLRGDHAGSAAVMDENIREMTGNAREGWRRAGVIRSADEERVDRAPEPCSVRAHGRSRRMSRGRGGGRGRRRRSGDRPRGRGRPHRWPARPGRRVALRPGRGGSTSPTTDRSDLAGGTSTNEGSSRSMPPRRRSALHVVEVRREDRIDEDQALVPHEAPGIEQGCDRPTPGRSPPGRRRRRGAPGRRGGGSRRSGRAER